MELELLKSILLTVIMFLAVGQIATSFLFKGKEVQSSARKVHKYLGDLIVALIALLAYWCIIRESPEVSTLRAGLHILIANLLVFAIVFKVLIGRFWNNLMKYTGILGILLFLLILSTFFTGAFWYLLAYFKG